MASDPSCPRPLPAGRAVLLGTLALLLLAGPAAAQQFTLDLGAEGAEGASLTGRAIQLFAIVTLLSLAPGIAIMVTCFPFIVTVLSILRQAVGVQQAPPNMLIVSLALFLTWFVMEPVFTEAWESGVSPLLEGTVEPEAALQATALPFRRFMEGRVDPDTVAEMRAAAPERLAQTAPDAPVSFGVLVPAFLLSEVTRGFEVGFLVFLPFLVIDLAVASILMSMGMMMVPPAVVSLPFKLGFFVLADGWSLLAGALVRSYGT
ncbi:flagellar type III secretion system pore protein FliP (plasmid) [Paroceanicella profunda]|uniref:Flagellar biosynthetic protein FliP n=1 Tax=Paroceanicella profunda TaxID=2579971 RepID=A0A5B8G3M2_9RHOB|nr:flagellar type III secretion system pore protein FliP [Paroceanicella profunda]QDL94754.1 flagellar type III secretion system pore protein FliP [Paroceanicella profunda]